MGGLFDTGLCPCEGDDFYVKCSFVSKIKSLINDVDFQKDATSIEGMGGALK